MEMSRKTFLSLGSGAVLAAGLMTRGRVWGANDRLRLACVGVRGRGWAHARAAGARDDVEIAALCDVDAEVLENRAAEAKQALGATPKTYRDIRDLFADDSIDAVTVATPNHWHVLCGVWAMQAGKDVYLEKPISHTIWEGRQLVAAAKQYGRVLQHGAQRRSDPLWQRAVERLRTGIIGEIYWAKCVIHGVREPFWFPQEETPPPSLDWALWQGPAPERPFSRNYVHYNWHWFWPYGNGEIGNNGPHWADLVNWMIDKGLPIETHSTGGIFGYDRDARETPNTQLVNHRFADGTLMQFEVVNRFCPSSPAVILYGTAGYMEDNRFYDKDRKEIPDDSEPGNVDTTRAHMDNFIEAVKAGNPGAANATAEQGHIAAGLCHLGNIAYRLNRSVHFDPKRETFPGDDEANALLTREYRPGFEVPKLA